MVGSAAPPTLALSPQLPRGFGAHSPSPRRRQQPPFLARWGHPAALLPVVTARGAGRRGAAPAGSDCGTCQMCMPRSVRERGSICVRTVNTGERTERRAAIEPPRESKTHKHRADNEGVSSLTRALFRIDGHMSANEKITILSVLGSSGRLI